MSPDVIVRMWEVKAHPEAMAELLSWVCESALPSAEVLPTFISGEVMSSADDRIVVITRWRSLPAEFEEPPRYLVARAAHFWDFSPVDR